MCRMFLKCSLEPFNIENHILKDFIKSCHWNYFKKYNILGHHNLGWGFAYIPEGSNRLIIKRDFNPIYKGDWKGLSRISTRLLVVHARKAYPWQKSRDNIHPINIGEQYIITHNGVIKTDSIPHLLDKNLQRISNNTSMDTRKYLCYLMNEFNYGFPIKDSIENVLQNIKIGLGANAFLFNSEECNIITYHNTNFNGRHTTLFLKRDNNSIFVSTTPILQKSKEIPNNTLIQVNLSTLDASIQKIK